MHTQIPERLICSILMPKGHHIFVSAVLVKKSYEEREGCFGFTPNSSVRGLSQSRASHTQVMWRGATKGF